MHPDDPDTFTPADVADWRAWLDHHHATSAGIWVVHYKRGSGGANLSWQAAVDEALCVGWIDSVRRPLDEDRYLQRFTPRKARSTWSRVNKRNVARLTAAGQMRPAGLRAVAVARRNGSWTLLDTAEALEVPPDLAAALAGRPGAAAHFAGLSRSQRKLALTQIALARRPATRQRRIDAVASAGPNE